LKIEGIGDWRLEIGDDCRLAIGHGEPVPMPVLAFANPQSAICNLQSAIRESAIRESALCNLQSAICTLQ
jgi:hypothetical protein